jgi:hypothetical protein
MTTTPVTVTKLSTYADPAFVTTQPTINPTKETTKMSNHNLTGYNPAPQQKRFVPGIGAVGGPTLLKALEGLGLINHSPTLHKLVASGQASVSSLGAQFTIYQVDEALSGTTASVSERMTFKNILDRNGLLKANLH